MKTRILLFLSIFLVVAAVAQKEVDYKKKGAPLPPFKLELTKKDEVVTNAHLKAGKPVMMMIFSPECDHCEHMIDSLKGISDMFKTTQLVLVAEARNKEHMKKFTAKTGISGLPLFQNIGVDKSNLIYYVYTQKILPQINFYDSKFKLVKTFDGNYPLDSVKMFIK